MENEEKFYLIFETENAHALKVSLKDLEKFVFNCKNKIELVFLNSCHSGEIGKKIFSEKCKI